MNINKSTEELQKIFNNFNETKFNNELEEPIIIIQTQGKHKAAGGWCTLKKIWTNKDKTEYRYEITVCAEYLTRGIDYICNIMLHEMVHLWNFQHEIKDCSNGVVYHNKKFKQEALFRGLNVDKDETVGWAVTSLNDETKDLILSFNIDESCFDWFRTIPQEEDAEPKPKKKRKSNIIKYYCPQCEAEIKSKHKINVLCIDCDVAFETEEDENDDENDSDEKDE